jgi:uncharacterized protein with NAD-binding domain and iron-sulfur cluster
MPKKRIAILGSGVGSITTAWALTSLPNWSDRFEITIYTLGWRLGGKGASGRNAEYGQRIEEHGLHIWMGFYDNAFRAMQQCYAELARPASCPIRTWTDAFRPHNDIVLYEFVNGRWRAWPIAVPRLPGVPGTDREAHEVTKLFEMLVHWMAEVFTSAVHEPVLVKLLDLWRDDGRPGWLGQQLGRLAAFMESHLPGLGGLTAAGHEAGHLGWLVEGLHEAGRIASAEGADAGADLDALVSHLEGFLDRLRSLAHRLIDANDDVRRVCTLMELGVAIARGMVRDGVLTRGFDAIAGADFREWLRRHGAGEEVRASAVVRTMYDLCFAFADGELDRPDMDAAVFLRTVLLMALTYRGAFMYRMNAGMGDVVFGPYYEALKRRGVRFEFFHRVRSLGLSGDGQAVDTIAVDRQVALKPGLAEYDPFVTVKGLPCWPSAPDFDQIEGGDALAASGQNLESYWCTWPVAESRELRRGPDFDEVVLGISLGALPGICAGLLDRSAPWREMCDRVKTVETQGVQIWLRRPLAALGWNGPPSVGGTYAEPLDTWADMSDLLVSEDWKDASSPQSIMYLCGPLRRQPDALGDPGYVESRALQVLNIARTWLQSHTAVVLPKGAGAHNPSGLDLDWLHAPDHPGDPLLDQYLRANIDPSERYVLSVAGSSSSRLRAGQSGFSNLFLAGDWVWTPINAGCVEAATMAGLDAARELSGEPIPIIGWPDLQPPSRGASS